MTDSSSRGFLQSLALHAAAAALALGLGFVAANREPEVSRIIELVAGEGDNYAATEAPSLGVVGGVKLSVPAAAAARPEPPALLRPPEPEPEVAPVALAPVAVPPPVPAAKAPPTPAPPAEKAEKAPPEKASSPAGNEAVPNFKKKIQYEIVRGDAKAKLQLRREREAEQKRQVEERKRQAEEAKRMTKEEFDRAQRAKGGSAKVARIDGEGIAKGVVGGSPANRKGGAGGKALTSSGEGVLDSYYAYFKRELRTAFEPPPGLSDSLKATLEVRSNPDGSLSNARITVPSGSREFDQAVLAAVRRVRMPARPSEHRAAETFEFVFTLRDRDQG
jgi:colicin import membrane protein